MTTQKNNSYFIVEIGDIQYRDKTIIDEKWYPLCKNKIKIENIKPIQFKELSNAFKCIEDKQEYDPVSGRFELRIEYYQNDSKIICVFYPWWNGEIPITRNGRKIKNLIFPKNDLLSLCIDDCPGYSAVFAALRENIQLFKFRSLSTAFKAIEKYQKFNPISEFDIRIKYYENDKEIIEAVYPWWQNDIPNNQDGRKFKKLILTKSDLLPACIDDCTRRTKPSAVSAALRENKKTAVCRKECNKK